MACPWSQGTTRAKRLPGRAMPLWRCRGRVAGPAAPTYCTTARSGASRRQVAGSSGTLGAAWERRETRHAGPWPCACRPGLAAPAPPCSCQGLRPHAPRWRIAAPAGCLRTRVVPPDRVPSAAWGGPREGWAAGQCVRGHPPLPRCGHGLGRPGAGRASGHVLLGGRRRALAPVTTPLRLAGAVIVKHAYHGTRTSSRQSPACGLRPLWHAGSYDGLDAPRPLGVHRPEP
jgi:hypothetical protein